MYIKNAERYEMVVKSNDLIQKSRFSLTTNQQKIILYLISKLKYQDENFSECKLNIKDFCEVCGIEDLSGRKYNELKNSIKQIADKSMWIEKENGEETLVRWIEKPTIQKNDGTIKIKLDEDLKPYLLNLKERYTQYDLIYTLKMKSKYSIRLYELLKSQQRKEKYFKIKYTIQEIKKLLDAENYTAYKDLRRRAIDKAIEEINEYADIKVSYQGIKNGKTFAEIEFSVSVKDTYNRFFTAIKNEKELDNE